MCGIAGVVRFGNPIGPLDVEAVARMSDAEAHRGPDGAGMYHDVHVALGHRRLSIIDVSDGGKQPMCNETRTVWVTYNGEIYNYGELRAVLSTVGHRFASQSDTEVLVHGYEEWGEEGLLQRLRGMFAFALYDAERGRVILARDRLGIKPLYYASDPDTGGLAFASEVKALVKSGLAAEETDRKGLAGFLLFGSVPSPRTIVRDVECLLPGHYLVADVSGIQTTRYWDLEFTGSGESDEVPLTFVLQDAMRRHLVSDVPVGVFLSGGVDSAGLVALADQQVNTLTISFSESEFNEGREARRIAEHFHTTHHELQVRSSDFVAELPNILAAMDQPTNDGVNTYFVAHAARKAGLTVVLSGLGGDELFWGYPHHRWVARNHRRLGAFALAPRFLRRALVSGAVVAGRLHGKESWMRLAALRSGTHAEGLYMAFRGFFASEQVHRLLGNSQSEMNALIEESLDELRPAVSVSRSDGFNYIELKRYLHDQLLRDSDVFGMAHSVEIRVPYLDDQVVARALAMPGNRKTSGAMNKPLLVAALGDALIEEAARRPKRGFSFPMAKWMHERTGAMREMAMSTKTLERDVVGKMWSAFDQGRLHWSRAWSLVVLGARA
jgi:asparagine synthase (glutamine-hydrolysing)